MAFGTQDDTDEVMNEINMTPLVDVMLVLLIIFMVTIPVMQHAVKVDLPRASNVAPVTPAEVLRLAVDAQGRYFLNEVPLDDAGLPERFQAAAAREPQPELHIQAEPCALRTGGAGHGGRTAVGVAQDRLRDRPAPALNGLRHRRR